MLEDSIENFEKAMLIMESVSVRMITSVNLARTFVTKKQAVKTQRAVIFVNASEVLEIL